VRAHYEPRALWMAGLLAVGVALVAQGATQMGLPIFWVVFVGTLVADVVWYEQVYWVGRTQGREAARQEAIAAAEPDPPDDPPVTGAP
jgi:membrane protein DedA with SNARE-associated domain